MSARILSTCLTAMLAGSAAWYPTHAFADGECSKGYRDTTAAERATMTGILTKALAALPPAPTGWVVTADGEARGPQSICRDGETTPWGYSISRQYDRVDDREARDQAFKAVADRANAARAAKQPRIDALSAKLEDIGKRAGDAAAKGDFARVQALGNESEAVQAQLQAVYDENDQSATIEAAGQEAGRDITIEIHVEVNPGRRAPSATLKPLPAPTGVQSAYRWSDEPVHGTQDHALLLLGTWKPAAEGGFVPVPRNGAAPVAANSLAIQVDADPSRIESILAAIKFNEIATTLR